MSMSDTQIPDPTQPDDSAQWAELQNELSDEDFGDAGQQGSDAGGQGTDAGQQRADADQDGDKGQDEQKQAPVPYEELERRHRQTSGALKEARERERQLRDQMSGITQLVQQLRDQRQQQAGEHGQQAQQQEQQPPSLEEDPIGYIQYMEQSLKSQLAERDKVIDELKGNHTQTAEQFEQDRQMRALMSQVQTSEQEIMQSAPDYPQACDHLENIRRGELRAMFPDNSPRAEAFAQQHGYQSAGDLREAMLNNDRIAVAQHAVQIGVPPAQLYYDLAVQRGYQRQQQGQAGQQGRPGERNSPPNAGAQNGAADQQAMQRANAAIDAARRGTKASQTISGGGGRSDNPMNISELADLYHDDPEAFDQMWEKMERSGQLG